MESLDLPLQGAHQPWQGRRRRWCTLNSKNFTSSHLLAPAIYFVFVFLFLEKICLLKSHILWGSKLLVCPSLLFACLRLSLNKQSIALVAFFSILFNLSRRCCCFWKRMQPLLSLHRLPCLSPGRLLQSALGFLSGSSSPTGRGASHHSVLCRPPYNAHKQHLSPSQRFKI